jgi:hypothetical protein
VADAFVTYCEFPALYMMKPDSHQVQPVLDSLGLTQQAFEDNFLSTRSALELVTGDKRLTRQLIVLDSNWKILERFLFKHLRSSQGWIASEVVLAFPLTWWAATFLAVITSSIVAGMFYIKETAVEILKYGILAFAGFAFLWLVLKLQFDFVRRMY